MLGTYKARAVPINVNYRYVADEARYILDNSDAVVVVHERAFAPLLATIRADLPKLRHSVVLEDGSRRGERRNSLRRRAGGGVAARVTSDPARPTTSTSSTRAAPPASRRA